MSRITQKKKKKKLEGYSPKKQYLYIPEHELTMGILMNELNWDDISRKDLSINFMTKYKDNLNWSIICYKNDIPNYYYKHFVDKLDWKEICKRQQLTSSFIKKYEKYMNWDLVATRGYINDDIFTEFFEELYCSMKFNKIFINSNTTISANIISQYEYYYDNDIWNSISIYKNLDDEFINKYKDKLNWKLLSNSFKFTETQIIKYKKYIKWNDLSTSKIMYYSSDFIKKEILPNITNSMFIVSLFDCNNINENELNSVTMPSVWKDLSYTSNLSFGFIKRNINKLNKEGLRRNRRINENVKEKLKKEGII